MFFFFKQKTAYEMRISDWSSDVCSSDLAVSYHEFVRAMYRAHADTPAIPAWLVCDRTFIRRYGLGLIRPRSPSLRKFVASGYLQEGRSFAALAQQIGVPAQGLEATVPRFNGFAASGRDDDFRQGENADDRVNGEPADRKSVVCGTSVSVRVTTGRGRIIK